MELIDRDELQERLKNYRQVIIDTYGKNDEYALCLDDVLYHIDISPTIDAVPVVRCKDCKNRPTAEDECNSGFGIDFPNYKCPCQCDDGFYNWMPKDDWFCADGERRTDE